MREPQRIALLALLAWFCGAPLGLDAKEGASTEIQWDATTDRVVSHTDQSAAYPRAKRLSNGEILLGYHHGGGLGEWGTWVTLRASRDGGATWYATRDLEGPEGEAFYGFSNVDFVDLGGGRVLFVTAGRGKPVPGQPVFLSECERSELRLRFSADHGLTWGNPVGLLRGRGRIWEPAIVRLPAGELEIYYAIEAPDLQRDGGLDQRIELVRSEDDGKTWGNPIEVSHHPGCRNGMPAPVVLSNGRVACAQEVVRDPHSPWITQTRRGRPVEQYVAQSRFGFGGAPFLLRIPGGSEREGVPLPDKTLLAFHSAFEKPPAPAGAPQSWMFGHIWVQAGDAEARNFGPATRPWAELSERTGAFFPSLMLKDDTTVVALASFLTQGADGSNRTVVRWREGKLKLAGPAGTPVEFGQPPKPNSAPP